MDIRQLDAVLGSAHRAFFDSSTCIANFSTTEDAHPLARHLFDRVADDTDPLIGYISIISAAEMLVRPIQAADHRLSLVHDFLLGFPNLHMLDADFEIALQAANIRAAARMAMADALLIGTAILAGCEVIVTNDARWSRRLSPLFPQFTWIYLGR
jgi:predicted nucleic acid-binding protein